jgi:hypothetical protein
VAPERQASDERRARHHTAHLTIRGDAKGEQPRQSSPSENRSGAVHVVELSGTVERGRPVRGAAVGREQVRLTLAPDGAPRREQENGVAGSRVAARNGRDGPPVGEKTGGGHDEMALFLSVRAIEPRGTGRIRIRIRILDSERE